MTATDEGVNGDYVARRLAYDWGFYHTATTNLQRIRDEFMGRYEQIGEEDRRVIRERIGRLLERVAAEPKTVKWKARATLGTAVRWYRDVVICPEGKEVDLDGEHTMVSCGYANMTPWHCPRDVEEDELRTRLEAMLCTVQRSSHCIFNLHAPPYDSALDSAPQLDASLKPVLVGGQPNFIPVGSRAVREVIARYQPLAGLHGHIHECKGAMRLGRTMCLNPGSEYAEGILRGVLLSIAGGRLLGHQFVAG